jgi:hypothetical protein
MPNILSVRLALASAALLAAAGCADTRPVPEVAAAHALVSQAEQSDAAQFASGDLEAARSKLRQADDFQHNGKPDMATRLAQESSADAEVAMARVRAIKAEQALADVNAGTQTLRNESRRNEVAAPPTGNTVIVPQGGTVIVPSSDSSAVQR